MAFSRRRIEVEIAGDSKQLNRALGSAQSRLQKFGRNTTMASRSLSGVAFAATPAIAGIAALGLGLRASVGSAVKFDSAMRNVNSIAQLSEDQFQSLRNQVLSLAPDVAKSPTELANGLYDIVSSGFDATEAIDVLRASANAANAGLTDTATAARAVAAILNAYGLEASKSREVSDELFETVNVGVVTFEELAGTLGDIVPQAAALGIPFREVGAALATITLGGTTAAEGGTQVGRVLAGLVKPTAALAKELRTWGFASGQAAVDTLGFVGVIERLSKEAGGNQKLLAEWLGDIRGIRGVLNLTGQNLQKFQTQIEAMGAATQGAGATQRSLEQQQKSTEFQWNRLRVSAEALATKIGDDLAPTAGKLADGLTAVLNQSENVITSFDDLIAQGEKIVETFGEAGAEMLEFAAAAKLASEIAAPGEGRVPAPNIGESVGGDDDTGGGAANPRVPLSPSQRLHLAQQAALRTETRQDDLRFARERVRRLHKQIETQKPGGDKLFNLRSALEAAKLEVSDIERGIKADAEAAANEQQRVQREAFDTRVANLKLALEKAGKTATLKDDTRIGQKIADAIRAQIKVEGRTAELEGDLFRLRQQLNEKLRNRVDELRRGLVDKLDVAQDKLNVGRQLFDARERLRVARQLGGPATIREAIRGLQDAQFAQARHRIEQASPKAVAAAAVTINLHGVESPEEVARRVVAILNRNTKSNATQMRGRGPGFRPF